MTSAKLTTPGLLKKTAFGKKIFDAIISSQDATNIILSRDQLYDRCGHVTKV